MLCRKQPETLFFEEGEKSFPVPYNTELGVHIIGFITFHPLIDKWSVKGWEREYFASEHVAAQLLVEWWVGLEDRFTYGPYEKWVAAVERQMKEAQSAK